MYEEYLVVVQLRTLAEVEKLCKLVYAVFSYLISAFIFCVII